MLMKDQKIWIFLCLAVILGALWQFVPLQDAANRLEKLPLEGLGYRGKSLPLNETEQQFLNKVNVLKRTYAVNGQSFLVTVVDGTNDRHVVHDPYFCFRGTGWKILKEENLALNRGSATKITLKKNDSFREALFWFTDGQKQFSSPLRYWVETSLRRLTLGASGGEPVLVVVQAPEDQDVNWDRFSAQFHPLLEL